MFNQETWNKLKNQFENFKWRMKWDDNFQGIVYGGTILTLAGIIWATNQT